jgi:hypothetical protein
MIRSILHDGPWPPRPRCLSCCLFSFLIMRPTLGRPGCHRHPARGRDLDDGNRGPAEVKITFLNFIALPITFGIGAEYGLNVAQRYRDDRDMVRAVGSTGAAVALCSWTTIVGYGSLLAASSRALRGFGLMAILGEVSCLAAALLALPAIILWRRTRQGEHE